MRRKRLADPLGELTALPQASWLDLRAGVGKGEDEGGKTEGLEQLREGKEERGAGR